MSGGRQVDDVDAPGAARLTDGEIARFAAMPKAGLPVSFFDDVHPDDVDKVTALRARNRLDLPPENFIGPGPAAGSGRIIEWPPLALPGTVSTPDIPADVLPGPVGDMVAAVAKMTQTPPGAGVILALAIVATCVQRRYIIAPTDDGYVEPLSIWGTPALESGARKTAVLNLLVSPMEAWEKRAQDRARSDLARNSAAREATKKRLEKLARDAGNEDDRRARDRIIAEMEQHKVEMPAELFAPSLFVSDATVERVQAVLVEQRGRCAVISDEAGQFSILAGMYSGAVNVDTFLQGHSGSTVRVDRSGRSAYIERPAISIAMCIQPGVMADVAAEKRFRDSGLLARILYCLPGSTVGRRNVRDRVTIPTDVADAYTHAIEQLLAGWVTDRDKLTRLHLEPAARELWFDFAQAVEDELAPGGGMEAMADWGGKLPGAVARIAGLMSLLMDGPEVREVGRPAVERAIRLGQLLIPHARAAFRLMGADGSEGDAIAVLKWIRRMRALSFTRRDAHRANEGRFRRVADFDEVAKLLHEWNVITKLITPTGKRGRSSPYYEVNPGLFVDDSCLSP